MITAPFEGEDGYLTGKKEGKYGAVNGKSWELQLGQFVSVQTKVVSQPDTRAG